MNPVPLLKQSDGTIPITFYFPVRFKDTMFALNDYLNDVLVGKELEWGEYTGKSISNLSLPRLGEIQDLDLQQFKVWVDENYNLPIEVMEPFFSMELTLYLSNANPLFIYGNVVKITNLTVAYKGEKILEDTEPICIDRADIGSSEPATQQLFSTTHAEGYPANAAYTKQLPLIVKNLPGYYKLLDVCENTKDIQNLTIDLEEEIPISDGNESNPKNLTVKSYYFISNYSRRTSLGQLLGISLTLADRKVEEQNNG